MSFKKILILTGYDYSASFEALCGYDFSVLSPKNEPSLGQGARDNLKRVLDERYTEIDYKDVAQYVIDEAPDFLITFGWRRIIPDEVIRAAKLAINIHPALLPEYKGYHPVPHVLINNESHHGITAHIIDSKLDAGDIIYQKKFEISKLSTLNGLQERVNEIMPSFLHDLCLKVSSGDYTLTENKDSGTKIVAGKRTPSDSEIPLDITMAEAYDRVRACDERRFPAFIMIDGHKMLLKIEKV